MGKIGKRTKKALEAFSGKSDVTIEEAVKLVKSNATAKFDETIEIAMNLGVDTRHADQMVRGVVTLPHGTGKNVRVLALVTPDKENDAKEAGADHVGLDDYLQKIKDGWTDIDVIVTMPSVMGKLGPLGRVLGPRGLMPNPKTGTVTMDVKKAVSDVKGGKIDFKVDKTGIVHATFGKVDFTATQLAENLQAFYNSIEKNRPSGVKGKYFKSLSICSTMGPSINLDFESLAA